MTPAADPAQDAVAVAVSAEVRNEARTPWLEVLRGVEGFRAWCCVAGPVDI